MKKRAILFAVVILLVGCNGNHNHSFIPTSLSSMVSSSGDADNIFARARGKKLSQSDLDTYIDPSVTGPDRDLARQLMASMPPNLRGDFIAIDANGHLVSNNPGMLRFAKVTTGGESANSAVQRPAASVAFSHGTFRRDFTTQCGPPPSNTGAFARTVSACGMTDGWGFVNVPCGTTYLTSDENAYLYMEISGNSWRFNGGTGGHLIEGGYQYNYHGGVGDTIQPYVRTDYAYTDGNGVYHDSGFQQLNYESPNYSYTCNQNLVITHGISKAAGGWIYTMLGQLPSSIDPRSQYINMNSQFFYPDNYVWLWTAPASDMNGTWTDAAGYPTPCEFCSVAKVTTIARNAGYVANGSYFGKQGNWNAINWMELIFGEYSSACTGSDGGTCQIESTPDASKYFAGIEYYPDNAVSQSKLGPTGWGPYESYDGIWMSTSATAGREAAGTFSEPLPPPPCTADSYGDCSIMTYSYGTATCYRLVWDSRIQDYMDKPYPYVQNFVYATYRATTLLGVATKTISKSDNCSSESITWSPSEPRTAYSDPYLP